jgi:hypothetical protein
MNGDVQAHDPVPADDDADAPVVGDPDAAGPDEADDEVDDDPSPKNDVPLEPDGEGGDGGD